MTDPETPGGTPPPGEPMIAAGGLGRLLFPQPPRRLSHARAIGIGFRTAHLATSGLLLGGHAFEVEPHRLLGLFWLTLASGVGLMALELYQSCRWVYLGQGVMVWVKLGLLLLTGLWWEGRVLLLLLVLAVASVGSHMASRYRHYSLWDGRVIEMK